MIERYALFTRLGKGGAYQVETRGLIAAAFTHRDSRAGDPDLHTHVVIANKVQAADGRWLAIDARVLFKAKVAASETYNTALEAHLRNALGVQFAARPTQDGKRPIRELVGTDPRLLAAWSRRRRAITTRGEELAQRFQADHHRPATQTELLALYQQANLETRNAKHAARTLAEQRADWRREADSLLGPQGVNAMLTQSLNRYPTTQPAPDADWIDRTAALIVLVMEGERATWQPWHVRAEAQRQARQAEVALPLLNQTVERLIEHTLDVHCLRVTSPEPGLGAHYTSAKVWAAEDRLLELAGRPHGHYLPHKHVQDAMDHAQQAGLQLNEGQRSMVWELATSGRLVQVALAPAGTGKTTAVSVLADAWATSGGAVVGLAPSAAARHLLAEALPGGCEHTRQIRLGLAASRSARARVAASHRTTQLAGDR